MLKSQNDHVTVLGLCVDEPANIGRVEGLDYCAVQSGHRAIEMLRLLTFDLLVVGMDIPDINTWDFVRRVKAGWSWQKWALVGGLLTPQEEISARMLGSVRIFDSMPGCAEVLQMASHLRGRSRMSVVSQPVDRTYRPAASQ